MGKVVVELRNIVKSYDDNVILKNINLQLEQGKFYTLLGPSGCGKTTILRIIGGFTEATSGDILFDGKRINDVPTNKRQVNTVFQNYALFPHMNVFENVAFGLKLKHLSKAKIKAKVQEALNLVKLDGYQDRAIMALSGGQQQRIAIARAIVMEPQVLLLDEPLSALDAKLRKEMQYELRNLQQRLGITFLFVTHDQEEALAMSDEIFVINHGQVLQSGTPVSIYDEPLNHFVADFIGESNIIPGRMIKDYEVEFLGKRFECADAGMKPNEAVEVVLRPEDLDITTPQAGKIVVNVKNQLFRGDYYEIVATDEDNNEWLIHAINPVKNNKIGITFDPEDIHVMRFNESETDFDARLDQYEGEEREK